MARRSPEWDIDYDVNWTTSSLGVTAGWVTVTPELAAKWLANNNKMNRSKRNNRINVYADQMTLDDWNSQNGLPYIFDNDGQIVDGQHRMEAQVKSDTTLEVLVVSGVEPQARPTIDDNAKRMFSDDLHMNGIISAHAKASLIAKILAWDTLGGLQNTGQLRFGRRYMARWWETYASEIDNSWHESQRWAVRWPGNSGSLAFMYWLLVHRFGNDIKAVERYFSILSIGSQSPEDEVLVRCREKLSKPIGTTPMGHFSYMPVADQVWWLIDSWSRWLTGKKWTGLPPRSGISDPYPVPVPAVGK